MPTLAIFTAAHDILPSILPALIALLVLIVVGTIALTVLRRSLKPQDADPAEGFTLHGLREMHARGDLSDAEFERAKAALIDRVRGGTSGNSEEPSGSSDTTPPNGPNGGGDSPEGSDTRESPDNL